MSVNSKMTAIANKIRALRGTSGTMGLDAMATQLGNEQTAITAALAALTEKGVDVPAGSTSDALAGLIAAIQAGGGAALWDGGKFTMGSFVLAEETTSKYIIATSADESMKGLLNEGETLNDIYREIGLLLFRKPTDSFTGSNYQKFVTGGIYFPTYWGSGAARVCASTYIDSYGTSAASKNYGCPNVSYTELSVEFHANYKGSPDFVYNWLAWRAVK